ncbi:hypothetical protein H4R18_005558 [Coemansia javaensis]|uniref:Arrestin C-terminal-like domain-containing protein n=1 Tax=Coemansia javaensis TaxID=2761396 RepID=A0A9W8H864_9FUNG|nr:hypothetical protein H4R18_005558 [Coemansia javaensis]
MRPAPSLEIVLDRPELLVRGSLDEATAAVLSGRLVVHLAEPIRVRSLRMTFTGRVDTFLNQELVPASVARDEHREFLAHEWRFLEPQKPPAMWPAALREFPFELVVRGDNPETVCTALGKVRYQLQATLERTAFHANLAAAVDVPLKRGPQAGAPWALALMESIESMGSWSGQLNYRISVPSRSLKDGELFHTRFELEPRAKGLRLVSVGVLVKEYTRYYHAGATVHRFARIVARNENYITPSGSCSMTPRKPEACLSLVDATTVQIPLAVPEAYSGVQYDVLTDLVEVRHRLKFLIKVRDRNALVHSIFVAVPVAIMPVKAREEDSLLPRYEAAVLNPGTVIMRSNTLPPSYDALQRPAVEPGHDIGGFPTALLRSNSQFYLASPDGSPALRAARGAFGDDNDDDGSIVQVSPDYSPLPAPMPVQPQSQPQPQPQPLSAGDGDASIASKDSAGQALRPPSLQERLAGSRIGDKMRAIFHAHGRPQSSGHRRNCSSTDSGHGIVRAATPPPQLPSSAVIREPPPAHRRPPRPCSVAPSPM